MVPETLSESTDTETLVSPESAQPNYGPMASKYVVDGFEVDSVDKLPLTNQSQSSRMLPIERFPKSQNVFDNSTFREISKLTNNQSNDKLFKKRNDFESLWSGITFSDDPMPNQNRFSDDHRNGYYRHRPQSHELILTNANPYMPRHSKPDTYYQYESESTEPVLPYRSRYQHKYREAERENNVPVYHQPKLLVDGDASLVIGKQRGADKPQYLKTGEFLLFFSICSVIKIGLCRDSSDYFHRANRNQPSETASAESLH